MCVEGGGGGAVDRECRKDLVAFPTRAGVSSNAVEAEACGPLTQAYRTFSADCRSGLPSILLVDPGAPFTAPRMARPGR